MNSILDRIVSSPCHPKNRGGKRTASSIKYLVYHYTGNDGDTDANNAKYYRDNVVKASAHYFVDDNSVTQSVEDLGIAYAVGGKKWADCSRTGGGSLYGVVTNGNSLSIELCDTRRDGQIMATEATLARAAELGRALMEKYQIPPERVVRHFDVTGKHCPAYFMDSAAWESFKARLGGEEEEEIVDISKLTDKECYEIVAKAARHAATLPLPTSWKAEEELKEAREMGITDGSRPMAPATRLEAAVMIKRAVKGKQAG